MGLLNSALKLAAQTAQPVDITAVRQYRSRLGASLNLEQQLLKDLGLFARVSSKSTTTRSSSRTPNWASTINW